MAVFIHTGIPGTGAAEHVSGAGAGAEMELSGPENWVSGA